jgi:hypothetical protein
MILEERFSGYCCSVSIFSGAFFLGCPGNKILEVHFTGYGCG